MTAPLDTDARIAAARDHLTAKLTELHRRQTAVVTALAPLRHLASPWLGVGIATLVGYRLGMRNPATRVERAPAEEMSLARAMVRATALVVVQVLARRVVTRISEPATD